MCLDKTIIIKSIHYLPIMDKLLLFQAAPVTFSRRSNVYVQQAAGGFPMLRVKTPGLI